jgi:hypothetical protein
LYNQAMKTFLILDAARCGSEQIDEAKALCNQAAGIILPLASNELYLEGVAPHLFQPENVLKEWYAENGWGDAWGVFFQTEASYETCLLHFQQIVILKDTRGSRYFRFYDPRVLKTFLPAADKNKLSAFFGPVEKFIAEGDTKETAVTFTNQQGVLQQSIVPAASVFESLESPAKKWPAY